MIRLTLSHSLLPLRERQVVVSLLSMALAALLVLLNWLEAVAVAPPWSSETRPPSRKRVLAWKVAMAM